MIPVAEIEIIHIEPEFWSPYAGYFPRTDLSPSQRSFHGCMQLIHVDEQLVDLHAVEQGTMGSFENVSLDMCAIIDRYVKRLLYGILRS